MTYLYNTLHYYESKLRDRPPLKRRLVAAVLGSLKEIRAPNWALSEAYQVYMSRQNDETFWVPDMDYYLRLVKRVVESILYEIVSFYLTVKCMFFLNHTLAMAGNNQFPNTDWRFNEFPNPGAHALYVTCVELMALPAGPALVGSNLLDVVAKGFTLIPHGQIHMWINAIGLIMAALPESYWSVLHDRLIEVISSPGLVDWPFRCTPFELFDFSSTHDGLLENKYSYTLALTHSMWHHAGLGQIASVPKLVQVIFLQIFCITNKNYLFYVCYEIII